MDDFDALASKVVPTRSDILDRVDEYTLYCYYLERGFIPGVPINSPLRSDDTVKSFSIFPAARGRGWDEFEFTWKDHGRGWVGNIFHLIQRKCGLNNFTEVFAKINQDFELDLNLPLVEGKVQLYERPVIDEMPISVKSIPLTYKGKRFWSLFRVDQEMLDFYCTTQIETSWSGEIPRTMMDPSFAYRIGAYYQIYCPYASRNRKFRNNLPENYFFGYLQLPPEVDLLIIDKSAKDVIFDRRLGYWAVAGKSETTLIPQAKMLELRRRAKRIVLTLDPDPAGIMQTEKYLQLYPWLEPKFLTDAKDKTDLCKAVGFDEAKKIIHDLIEP
jgi:hypothetical protein